MEVERDRNLWITILKILENSNTNLKATKSLYKGIAEITTNNKVKIYLDRKNLKLFKSPQITDQIKKTIFEILGNNYSIEFKTQENEYEFLNKTNLFIERINKLDFHSFNQNISSFKSINKFLSSNDKVCYLIGNTGIGKTHFMGVFLNSNYHGNFIYIDCFELINKFYENKRLSKTFRWFIQWISEYDLVVLDSFQLMKNEYKTKEIIVDLISSLTNKRKVIIIANDENIIPKNLNKTLVIRMNDPEIKDVRVIVNRFLEKQNKNIRLTQESINYLVNHLGNNVQIIMDKLRNLFFILGNPNTFTIVDLDHLKSIINDTYFFNKKQKSINFSNNQQVKVICEKFNFDIYEIFMNTRKKEIVFKRNLVIYILKKKFNLTHEEIGKIFNKNHSTISHSIQKVENKLEDKHFRKYLDNFFNSY